jgi:hypothetical protein
MLKLRHLDRSDLQPDKPPVLEPALGLAEVCKLRGISRRTGERERSEGGIWPAPDFFVGAGNKRKTPRWHVATIRTWLAPGGGHE